jgi:hypothetical protein
MTTSIGLVPVDSDDAATLAIGNLIGSGRPISKRQTFRFPFCRREKEIHNLAGKTLRDRGIRAKHNV